MIIAHATPKGRKIIRRKMKWLDEN